MSQLRVMVDVILHWPNEHSLYLLLAWASELKRGASERVVVVMLSLEIRVKTI